MISVIVCTHNRAETLGRMLEAFFAQPDLSQVHHEIIVVDNHSTDHTVDVVERFTPHKTLEYVYETKQGHTFARNRGIAESRGEIVAFLDDDVIVDAQWLLALSRAFEETDADVVGGKATLIFEAEVPAWMGAEFRKALSEVDLGEARKDAGNGQRLYGLNIAFRKKSLQNAGGFDDDLGRRGEQLQGGDEQDLVGRIVRAGSKTIYEPLACVGHLIGEERLQWSYFVRLAESSAKTRARLDYPAPLPERLRRFAETTGKLMWYGAQVPFRFVLGTNRYGYRNGVNQVIRARVQWRGRLRQVFLPHRPKKRTWFPKP